MRTEGYDTIANDQCVGQNPEYGASINYFLNEALQLLAGRDGYLHESPYYTDEDVIDLLSCQKEFNFKTGEQYMYLNTGYFLMGIIVGWASGMKMTEFAKKYITPDEKFRRIFQLTIEVSWDRAFKQPVYCGLRWGCIRSRRPGPIHLRAFATSKNFRPNQLRFLVFDFRAKFIL